MSGENSSEARASGGDIDFATVIANSVHDIKNSLGMLLSTLEDFSQDLPALPEGKTEQINRVRYETRRINAGLVQMLAVYKAEHQQITANVQEVDPEDLLLEIELENSELLASAGIEIASECNADESVFIDFELVKSVLNGVLNNAYRYVKSQLRLSAYQEDGFTVFVVLDDGRGYPPAMLGDAAEIASRTQLRAGSTGLGLHFAAKIAAMHRNRERVGRVELDNEGIGSGGRFRLYIP